MEGPRDRLPYFAFASAALIWGSTFLAIKIGTRAVDPLWSAAIRLVLASLVLTVVCLALGIRFPRGRRLQAALLYGFFQFGVNFALLYWGEVTVSSGVASIFYATIPLSTVLFAWSFGLERPDAPRVGGALVAFAGVAAIFAGELGQDVPVLALAAVFVAATAAALSGVLLKRAPQDAVPANAVGAAVGAAVCLAGSFALGEGQALPTGWGGWGPILYLTAAGSLGAFVLWSWLLKIWPATHAAMITVIVPVLAVLLGTVLNGERPAPMTFVGAAIVLAAVLWVLLAPHPQVPAAPRAALADE